MNYKEIVTNIRAPVDDNGCITAISHNLHSKLIKKNITWAHGTGAASWQNEFHAPYGGLDIRSSYGCEVGEKKSDSCLELSYDYNKPFKQLEKHDIPTLDDLIILEGQRDFHSNFKFHKGQQAKLHKYGLIWGYGGLSFAFKESGDIEEIEVEYAGRHAGLWGEFCFFTTFKFDYESNNIDISFDPKSNYSEEQEKKLWQNYIDGKVPSSDIKDPTYIHGTAFPFEVKYADKSIQHIESISTYIVDLDLNKHWVTFKI